MTPRAVLVPARLAGAPLLRAQSDERLVDLVRAGNDAAFEAIVGRYRRPLLRYCSGFMSEARAEDAVQQALVSAYRSLRTSEGEMRLRPWLYRIAHNTALNALRDRGLGHEQLPEEIDGVERPEEAFEKHEDLRDVVTALGALPERQRNAIVLRELEGRSYGEIASELGVSDGSVRQLLNRARNALRTGMTMVTPYGLLVRVPWGASGESVAARVAEIGGAGAGGAVLTKVCATALVTGAVVGGVASSPSGGLDEGRAHPEDGGARPGLVSDAAGPGGRGGEAVAPDARGDGGEGAASVGHGRRDDRGSGGAGARLSLLTPGAMAARARRASAMAAATTAAAAARQAGRVMTVAAGMGEAGIGAIATRTPAGAARAVTAAGTAVASVGGRAAATASAPAPDAPRGREAAAPGTAAAPAQGAVDREAAGREAAARRAAAAARRAAAPARVAMDRGLAAQAEVAPAAGAPAAGAPAAGAPAAAQTAVVARAGAAPARTAISGPATTDRAPLAMVRPLRRASRGLSLDACTGPGSPLWPPPHGSRQEGHAENWTHPHPARPNGAAGRRPRERPRP